jgi:outer membrane protein assembly factor BamB
MGLLMTRTIPAALFVISLTLVSAGCGGLKLAENPARQEWDWVLFGGSPSRSNGTATGLEPPLTRAWEYDALAGVTAAPLVRDSIVLLATLRGELHAVHLGSGASLGRKVVTTPINGTPVWYGSTIIAGGGAGPDALVAYDLLAGNVVWRSDTGPVSSSVLLSGDRVIVSTIGGALICLDAANGDSLWSVQLTAEKEGEQVRSSPAEESGIVVVGSNAGTLFAVNRSDGTERWRRDLGRSIFSTPVIGAGRVIAGSVGGDLFGLSLESGEILWRYAAGSAFYGSAALAHDAAVIGSADGVLHAIDPATGKNLWRFKAKSVINTAPLVSGRIVYAGSLDRTLYALDLLTGAELWRWEAPGRIKVTPVQAGSTLLVVAEDRSLVALRKTSP